MDIKKPFHILALGIFIGFGVSWLMFTRAIFPWFLEITGLSESKGGCVDFSGSLDKENLEYDEEESSQRPDFLKEHEIPI